jgi:protein-tyrosine phosphatase
MQGNTKLVVNCFAGMSRSSTAVITYLILKKGMTAVDALTMLKKSRDVWPSNAFLKFLAQVSICRILT